jgi:hypothetical protein
LMALISILNLDDSLTNKSYIPVTVILARKSVIIQSLQCGKVGKVLTIHRACKP